LTLEHNLAVLVVAAICFCVDLVVYRLAKEEIRIGSRISKSKASDEEDEPKAKID